MINGYQLELYENDPGHGEAWKEAIAKLRQGDYTSVVAHFQRLMAERESVQCLHNLGVALFGLGRFTEAQAAAEKALSLILPESPKDKTALDWLIATVRIRNLLACTKAANGDTTGGLDAVENLFRCLSTSKWFPLNTSPTAVETQAAADNFLAMLPEPYDQGHLPTMTGQTSLPAVMRMLAHGALSFIVAAPLVVGATWLQVAAWENPTSMAGTGREYGDCCMDPIANIVISLFIVLVGWAGAGAIIGGSVLSGAKRGHNRNPTVATTVAVGCALLGFYVAVLLARWWTGRYGWLGFGGWAIIPYVAGWLVWSGYRGMAFCEECGTFWLKVDLRGFPLSSAYQVQESIIGGRFSELAAYPTGFGLSNTLHYCPKCKHGLLESTASIGWRTAPSTFGTPFENKSPEYKSVSRLVCRRLVDEVAVDLLLTLATPKTTG